MNTDTNTLESSGRINAGAYVITYVAYVDEGCFISLYDANKDDEWSKNYGTIKETLETVILLLTSETMREEFCK